MRGTSSRRPTRRPRRAYSLLEMLITLLIIQMISGMVLINVSSVQATERLNRAGQQVIVAFRYARILAMSTGAQAGVEFNTSTNSFRVFQGAAATTVNDPMAPSGTYLINLNTQPDISNVTIASVANLNAPGTLVAATNPYQVTFGTLGAVTNIATAGQPAAIKLKYGGLAIEVDVPAVGEATVRWP